MGSDGVLARVTYLPGVIPPSGPACTTHPVGTTDAASVEELDGAGDLDHAADLGSTAGLDNAVGLDGTPPKESAKDRRRAENVSMRALTRRDLSRWELEKALIARELDDVAVEAELERLENVGLIDDAALAEMLVRTRHERKGLGRVALGAELRRRHIDQLHIDAALAQIDDDDERATAVQLAERRAPQLRGLDRDTATRRLSGYLMRKGYGSDTVRVAVQRALPRTSQAESHSVRFR